MRRICTAATITLAALALDSAATAQPMAPARPRTRPMAKADPAKVAKMEAVLREWAARSAEVKTLDAKFERIDRKPLWDNGKPTTYRGRALLQSPNKACINIEKIVPPDKKGVDTEFYERIVCTGKDVFHYTAATTQIFVYPLDAAVRGHALEEGPLPFLFDMRVDEAKRRYHMTYNGEDDIQFNITIEPLQAIDRENFTLAKIYLNKKTYLPDSLVLNHPNGKDTESYLFSTIERNKEIRPSNFAGGDWGKPWKLVRADAQPDRDPRPAAGAPGPQAKQAAALKPKR